MSLGRILLTSRVASRSYGEMTQQAMIDERERVTESHGELEVVQASGIRDPIERSLGIPSTSARMQRSERDPTEWESNRVRIRSRFFSEIRV